MKVKLPRNVLKKIAILLNIKNFFKLKEFLQFLFCL